MSTGMVICSRCQREVHQDGDHRVRKGWRHCEDGTPICDLASAAYPMSVEDVRGSYCCADGPLPTRHRGA